MFPELIICYIYIYISILILYTISFVLYELIEADKKKNYKVRGSLEAAMWSPISLVTILIFCYDKTIRL